MMMMMMCYWPQLLHWLHCLAEEGRKQWRPLRRWSHHLRMMRMMMMMMMMVMMMIMMGGSTTRQPAAVWDASMGRPRPPPTATCAHWPAHCRCRHQVTRHLRTTVWHSPLPQGTADATVPLAAVQPLRSRRSLPTESRTPGVGLGYGVGLGQVVLVEGRVK